MKLPPTIFVLIFLNVLGQGPVQAKTWFEFPQERRHLGFVLAQGPSGESQAALPEYRKARGLLDGKLAAEFKGIEGRWFWAGYLSGFSTLGLFEFTGFAAKSDAPLKEGEYRAIQGKGHDYIEGFREGYQKHIRARRKARVEEGRLWGICTLTGILTLIAIDYLN